MRKLLAALVVVALLLVGGYAADRYAVDRAERQVTDNLMAQNQVATRPDVQIHGFPFLTQLAASDFELVTVTAPEFAVSDGARSLTLAAVDLELRDVIGTNQFQTLVAGELDGQAVVPWSQVAVLVGQPIRHAGGDRVAVEHRTEVFGATVTAVVTGVPELDAQAQTLRLGQPSIEVAGYRLPEEVARRLIDRLVRPVPLALPMGLRVTELTAGEPGLALGVTGRNVPLTR